MTRSYMCFISLSESCNLYLSRNRDAGGSCTLATPFSKGDPSLESFDLKNGAGADCAVKEKKLCVASKSSQVKSGFFQSNFPE